MYSVYYIHNTTYAYLHVFVINLSIILNCLWKHIIGNEFLNKFAYCVISKLEVDDKIYASSTLLIICCSNSSS